MAATQQKEVHNALQWRGLMRYWGCCFARQVQVVLLCCAAAFLVAAQSSAYSASPSTEVKKILSKMDRQLCRSISLANCKRRISQKKSRSKAGKKDSAVKSDPHNNGAVRGKSAFRKIVDDRKSPALIPLPVLKEARREVDSNTRSPEKVRIPRPTLKPASLTKEVTTSQVPRPVEKVRPIQKLPEIKVSVLPPPKMAVPYALPSLPHAMPDGTATGEACFDSLAKLGIKFTRLTTNVGTGVCTVSDAVQVHSMSVGEDTLKLSDQPTFNCGFALKFASWLKLEARPIVAKATGKNIATFGTGPGFQCRGRNGDSGAKLSEHAFGNAVDIERIKLEDGEVIDVKDAATSGAKFQPVLAALRATACQYFTTVLGPGTNAAHATHFHFDLARRGKKGNHKMCQ